MSLKNTLLVVKFLSSNFIILFGAVFINLLWFSAPFRSLKKLEAPLLGFKWQFLILYVVKQQLKCSNSKFSSISETSLQFEQIQLQKILGTLLKNLVYTSDFGILVRRKITESVSTVFNKNVGDLTILYVIELKIIFFKLILLKNIKQ